MTLEPIPHQSPDCIYPRCDYAQWGEHIKAELSRFDKCFEMIYSRLDQIEMRLREKVLTVTHDLKETMDSCQAQNLETIARLKDVVERLDVEVGKLNVKAGVWGAVAGSIGALGIFIFDVFHKGASK